LTCQCLAQDATELRAELKDGRIRLTVMVRLYRFTRSSMLCVILAKNLPEISTQLPLIPEILIMGLRPQEGE
jgi:hypothetical protein